MEKKNVYIISGIVLIFILGLLIFTYSSGKQSNYILESRTLNVVNTDVGGSDAVAWVRVPGTNIDYPVIYETAAAVISEQDYLWVSHVTAKDENRMAISGHNIRNVSRNPIVGDNTMVRFEQLMGYVYKDFMQKHQYIQLTKNGEDVWYKIYAVGFDDDSERAGYYANKEYTKEYIEKVRESSLYKLDVEVDENDEIIALITCTRYFGKDKDDQFRVDARRLREDELPKKYKVETTRNYDIIK